MTRGRGIRQLGQLTATAVLLAACGGGTPTSTRTPAATEAATPRPTATTAAATSTAPPIAVGPGEQWILFEQFAGGDLYVVLARPDGSASLRPTRGLNMGLESNPDWSPDGQQFVFAVGNGDGDREELWIANVDGTGRRQLAPCSGACQNLDDPDWSPDGTKVLYSRNSTAADGSPASAIESVDVASGAITVIQAAAPGYFYAGQRYSPDGTSIVLEVVQRNADATDIVDVSLAIIDVAHPTPAGRNLTAARTFPETAAWTPDGSEIVFGALATPGDAAHDLFAIKPDGSGLRRITTLGTKGGNATHPDVSPDGTTVAFAANTLAHGLVLAQVPLAGGDDSLLLGGYVEGAHPRWRPVP